MRYIRKAIKENCYRDDLCDLTQGNKLDNKVYKIFETVEFPVRELISNKVLSKETAKKKTTLKIFEGDRKKMYFD